jgi:FkbM family methyltransferase
LNEYTQCNYFFGNISFDLFKLIKRIANEKYTFIDIGANIGLYSIISSYYFSKCFAFEPQPNCIDSFNTHISDNNIKNITILPFGLSEIAGKHELLLDPLNQGGASLVKPGGYHKKSKEDLTLTNKLKSSYSNILIDILTLDFCFFENNLIESSRSPKLIKIDVEGHEESVLRGAFMLIEKYNPVLFIEVESVQRVLKMLDILPAGYIAYDFSTNKVINQDSILINFVDVIFYHSRDLESQQIILNIFKTV